MFAAKNLNQNDELSHHEIYETLCHWFHSYIKNLECPDEQCRSQFDFKQAHSLRVVDEITLIGQMLKLSAHNLLIARTIALLHDVGRFKQFQAYRTYKDHISLDHGRLGVQIIKKAGLLNAFSIENQAVIFDAIFHHNKHDLPENLPSETSFFSKLIRDADKLDILRINVEERFSANKSKEAQRLHSSGDVSDQIFADLMHGNGISYDKIENEIDLILSRIGWIYDLNFIPTICLFSQRDYFKFLTAILPSTKKVTQILNRARKYLEHKMNTID